MGINLTEISQKVLDNNKNAANVFRKMYDLHYNPNPLDVPFEYIDENGNKVTTSVPNRSKIRADFEEWRNDIYYNFLHSPNLLKNTKSFNWTDKKKSTFYENTLPDNWSWYNYNNGDTAFKAMIIPVKDNDTLNSFNIPDPKGAIPLIRSDGYGADEVSILYLEITKTTGETIILAQDCSQYTSWGVGNFITGMRYYSVVIDGEGDIGIDISNRFASNYTTVNDKGKGWQLKVAHKNGFGGCIQGHVIGNGSLKVAIALPYAYVGYIPENIHFWAGFVGSSTAYTHKDLIV